MQSVREVFMFCDIHAHSRLRNIFIFGCNNNYNKKCKMQERVFPLMFHKQCEHFFYDNCRFDYPHNGEKDGTGRITVRKEFGIVNSFTLECSVCGPSRGSLKGYHFNIQILKSMGSDFCRTLHDLALDYKKVN